MKFIFLDCRMPSEMVEKIESRGLCAKLLPLFEMLDVPVASHPDMLVNLADGRILVHRLYHDANRELFYGLPITLTDEPMGKKYPSDILLNGLKVGRTVYGRREISRYLTESSERFVKVKQGYTRCSTLMLEAAAVTADSGIAAALRADGIDVLTITPGSIRLDGYDCGFIGGASTVVEREVLFFGDVASHPDGEKIADFCEFHGYKAVSLGDSPLYDYGGGLVFDVS